MTAGRTFGVLYEIRKRGEIDRRSEFIDFDPPESAGPTRTLESIARCRVETQLLRDPDINDDGRRFWAIVKIDEVKEI